MSQTPAFSLQRIIRVGIRPLHDDDAWRAGDLHQWRWTDRAESQWQGLVLRARSEEWLDGLRLHALCGTALPPR